MSFRRSESRHDIWQSHVREHAGLVEATGIVRSVVASERLFRRLLTDGRAEGPDGSAAELANLSSDQFKHLMTFVLHVVPFDMDTAGFEAFEARRGASAG